MRRLGMPCSIAADVNQLFSEHAISQSPSRPSQLASSATVINVEDINATICITFEATLLVRGFNIGLFMDIEELFPESV